MSAASELPRLPGFHVLGQIATGGMAQILVARREGAKGFERPVAIKRALPHLSKDPAYVDMFLDEARIASMVRHPNVIHIEELFQSEGELFLVMEYLEGESLAGLQRRLAARDERLPVELACYVAAEAAAGLHAAHEIRNADGESMRVVHRDVSPHNVFLTYDGHVKVIDFGVAKAAERLTRTDSDTVKGKFEYMSPEQCLNEELDRRSDLFSLGIVLHEMLSGKRLFRRNSHGASLRAILEDPVPAPSELRSEVPPAVDEICLQLLRRSPGSRPETAMEAREALLDAVSVTLPERALGALLQSLFADRRDTKRALLRSDRTPTTSAPAVTIEKRRPRGLVVAGAATLLAAVGLAAFVAQSEPKPIDPPTDPTPPAVGIPPVEPPETEPDSPPDSPLATIRKVRFSTTPPGATITTEAGDECQTPCSLDLQGPQSVTITHARLRRPLRRTIDADQSELRLRLRRPRMRPSKQSMGGMSASEIYFDD